MAEFTPGPWFVISDLIMARSDDPDDHLEIADYDRDTRIKYDTTGQANARLMAASPDLYAALNALLSHYRGLVNSGDAGFWDPETEPVVIAAAAALAQVEQSPMQIVRGDGQ